MPQHDTPRTVTGIISVVQEQRFQVIANDGVGLLLTLARNADLPLADLVRLHDTRTPVIIKYVGQPNLATGVAQEVQPVTTAHVENTATQE